MFGTIISDSRVVVGYSLSQTLSTTKATSVALSSDNSTLAIGCPDTSDDTYGGNVYVYIISGGIWTSQATIQIPSSIGSNGNEFGIRVSLSSSGDTLAIFGFEGTTSSRYPKIFIYTRSGGVWSHQQTVVGYSLGGLSSDGNTLVTGVYNNDIVTSPSREAPTVRVYVRSGGVWTLEQQINLESYGISTNVSTDTCSVSTDGNTLAVFGEASSNFKHLFFTRSGGVWTLEQQISTTSTNKTIRSCALSSDGNTALFSEDTSQQETRVYVRSGGVWTLQTTINEGGYSTLTSDGNTLVVSRYDISYFYTRISTIWNLAKRIRTSSEYAGGICLAPDGSNYVECSTSGTYIYPQLNSSY